MSRILLARKVLAESKHYDANGNMTSRAGKTITWYSYNKPNRINFGTADYAIARYIGRLSGAALQLPVELNNMADPLKIPGGLAASVARLADWIAGGSRLAPLLPVSRFYVIAAEMHAASGALLARRAAPAGAFV